MFRRSISAVLSLVLVAMMVVPAAADSDKGPSSLVNGRSAGFTVPVSGVTDGHGTFTGTLRILRFAVKDDKLVASGIVTGMLVENGVSTSVLQTVTLPVKTDGGATTLAAPAAVSCDILHLELGPLDLDLLGLVVHLDKVVLDLTAVPGAGNLLGNLLCAVTNLLNGGGALTQIAGLLNQILDLLT